MQNYKTLIVWQKAHAFALCLYRLTMDYPKTEQYAMTSQLRRACVSIPSNIAEGCGKHTDADLANFLQTALGSSNEVEYLLLLSHELGYLKDDLFKDANAKINEVKAMLITLINKIRNRAKT